MQSQETVGGRIAASVVLAGMGTAAWQLGDSGEVAGALFWAGGAVNFFRACETLVRRAWEQRKLARGIIEGPDAGGARWASRQDVKRLGLNAKTGIYLGRVRGREIRYDGPSSVAVVAHARSGKGTDFLLPTLLTCDRNMVVADPKGELAAMTWQWRAERLEHQVMLINPWRLHGMPTCCHNPLLELDAGDRNIRPYAGAISGALLPESARPDGMSAQFFNEHARNVLTSLILWLKFTDPDNCNLIELRRLTHLEDDELKDLFERMAAAVPGVAAGSPIAQLMREFAGPVLSVMKQAPQQHAGVIGEAVRGTEPFDGLSEISDILTRSHFSFADLKTRRMTVFLMVPTHMLRFYARWYQLMIDLAVEKVARANGK